MKTFRQMFPIVTAAVAVCALTGSTANAGFLAGGNTRSEGPPVESVDASTSFVVYDKTGGVAGDSFGTGFAGIDALLAGFTGGMAGNYLYLYQVVNDGLPDPGAEEFFSVAINAGALGTNYIGYGALAGLGFIDADGVVGVGNPFGTNGLFLPEQAPADLTFAAPAVTVVASGGIAPTGFATGAATFFASFGTPLSPGTSSTLFGFTSNLIPALGLIDMLDTGSASGTVIVPTNPGSDLLTPVPGTVMLFGSLFPLLAGAVYRKRNHQAAA